ncbi:MAG: acylphosphatase, partial [Prochlorococcaceae cyanobacterium]
MPAGCTSTGRASRPWCGGWRRRPGCASLTISANGEACDERRRQTATDAAPGLDAGGFTPPPGRHPGPTSQRGSAAPGGADPRPHQGGERWQLAVRGRVQGVGYRLACQRRAADLGLG